MPWLRRGVWAVAAAGTVIGVFCFWQKELVAPAAVARRDFAGARAALDRLAWFGVGNPVARQALVRAEGEYDARLQQLEAELGEQPGVAPALALGQLYEEQGDWADALRTYDMALAGGGADRPELLYRAGSVALRMGRNEQAAQLLERAVLLRPWHEPSQRELELARRSLEGSGRTPY